MRRLTDQELQDVIRIVEAGYAVSPLAVRAVVAELYTRRQWWREDQGGPAVSTGVSGRALEPSTRSEGHSGAGTSDG